MLAAATAAERASQCTVTRLHLCLVRGDHTSIMLRSEDSSDCTLEHDTWDFNLFKPEGQTVFTDSCKLLTGCFFNCPDMRFMTQHDPCLKQWRFSER